jgi:hypothetical protein
MGQAVTPGLSVRFVSGATKVDHVQRQIIVAILLTQFQMRRGNLALEAVSAANVAEAPQALTYEDACMQALLQVRQFARMMFAGIELEITYEEPPRSSRGKRVIR